jgi:hypothetical protein
MMRAMDPAAVVVCNARPGLDRNTCGQAAVATVLRFHGISPLAADMSDGAVVDAVCADFAPDLPFGLGTSAYRIADALRAHGLEVEIVHSGWFARRRVHALKRLLAHLEQGLPAPVCLCGRGIGGGPWSAHWAVALANGPSGLLLGNVGPDSLWRLDRFLEAWACRHLPYPHNHCAVLARAAVPATEARTEA